jgi:hypothetical protein
LEFCFEARRAIRSKLDPESGWRRVLDLFLTAQGGGAAAIIESEPGLDSAVRQAIVRVAVLSPSGSSGREAAGLIDRIFQAVPSIAGPLLGGERETGAGAVARSIPWTGPRGQARALVAILPPECRGDGIPPRILEELPFILEEVERAFRDR